MSEPLEVILSIIDSQYSRKHHMGMLRFLAQCIVSHEQLERCEGVPEVYRMIRQKCSNDCIAVALLKHMLRVTGYKKPEELQRLDAHCDKESNLNTVVPTLAFYELLLLLAKKLYKNNNFEPFLEYIDDKKLNKSKHDILSPLDLLQSMLYKLTIDPKNLQTLKDELVTPLKNAGMDDEAQFMERSILSLDSNEERSFGVAVYFNFDGQFQQPSSSVSGVCIQRVSDETIEALVADLERYPLLHPPHTTGSIYSTILKVVLKWKRSCLALISPLLLVFILACIVFAIFAALPILHHTQPVYGNVVYSAFSMSYLLYGGIETTIRADTDHDLTLYNLTICQTECSWKTHTKYFNVSNGVCPTNRRLSNCFVQLNEKMHNYTGTDSQVFSIYLLRNSRITFRVTESNIRFERIQLCITTDKDACNQSFLGGNHALCHKLMTFSKTNNYTQTFRADDDSYYCAVWLLENTSQFNYSTNSSIRVFNMSDFYSSYQCETFQKRKNIIFPLREQHKWESACIVMEENSYNTYFDNITIVSTAYKRLNNYISIPISVISGLLTVLLSLLLLFVIVVGFSPFMSHGAN